MSSSRSVADRLVTALAVGAVVALMVVVGVFAVQMASVATPAAEPIPPSTEAPAPDGPEIQVTTETPQVTTIDPAWLDRVSSATGIPARALSAYASAHLTLAAENPGCGIRWNTLAGIGAIESDHGRHGGAVLREDGYPDPAIRGIPLDGSQSARIDDTDGGVWDGDTVWDRAVGPLQFIPDTWVRWGADGNGDGVADPNQIDDAALAAARYLCHGGPMTTPDGWRAAIFSYNHLDTYVDDVAIAANRYAALDAG
jgi:membrane-bound lytic murein transglycosylase B